MKSIDFPKIFRANRSMTSEGKYATSQNLRLLLLSRRGELFGDPQYGSTIFEHLYEYNNFPLQSIFRDNIYTLIQKYFPQLKLERSDITFSVEPTKIYITIKAIDKLTDESNMFNIDMAL